MQEKNPSGALDGFQLMGAGAAFKNEICEMIADTRLFADFDWPDIEILSGYMQCYQVAARTTIFKEGSAGSYMCLLIKGEIEILKEDHLGKQRTLFCATRGKTFGEMSIIDGEVRSAICIAKHDCVLLLLTKDNYARIIKEHPIVAVHILSKLARLMSQRLRGMSGQLVEFLGHENETH